MTLPAGARVVEDPGELEKFYADNRAAHIYALVDLETPYWEPSTWYRRGDAVVGLVNLPGNDATTVYAVSTRDTTATLALVVDLLPVIEPGTLITAPCGLSAALRGHRSVSWQGPHVRYVLDELDASLPKNTVEVQPLDRGQLADLRSLYASDPGAAFFLPHMVDDRSFVGIYEQGELIAAAGTHVLSTAKRCAAVGSVYTRPAHRGRGLGRAVTAGVVARIADRVDLIGLNVAADNDAAQSVYRTLGFRAVLSYAEAELAP